MNHTNHLNVGSPSGGGIIQDEIIRESIKNNADAQTKLNEPIPDQVIEAVLSIT